MLDVAQLLTRGTKRALVDIMNYHNNTLIQPDKVKIGKPVVVSGRKTQVVVESTEAVAPTYIGSAPFTYNRLDLAEFFAPVSLSIEVNFPATTFDVTSILAERFSLFFEEGDFIIDQFETPSQMTYLLKAHPDSLRWVGQVEINLSVTTSLQTYLDVTTLSGLENFSAETPLSNLYRIIVLNGLSDADLLTPLVAVTPNTNLVGMSPGVELTPLDEAITDHYMDGHWEMVNGLQVMRSDFTQNPLATLQTLINNSTRLDVGPENYTLSDLRIEEESTRNTSVLATANADTAYEGSVRLYFNRIDLQDFFETDIIEVSSVPSLEEVIAEINTEHGINLDASTIALSQIDDATWRITLQDDYMWIGTLRLNDQSAWDWTPQVTGLEPLASNNDLIKLNETQTYSFGPAAIGQTIDPTDLHRWTVKAEGGVISTKVDDGEFTVRHTHSATVDHVTLTFDQSGNHLIAFESEGKIFLYWFDPQVNTFVSTELDVGSSPYVRISNWHGSIGATELLLVYYRDGDIRYRRQLDRYRTEYSLAVADGVQDVVSVEHNRMNKLVVQYVNGLGEIANIATAGTGHIEYDTTGFTATGTLNSLLIEDAVVEFTATDVEAVSFSSDSLSVELQDVVIHTVSPSADTTTVAFSGSLDSFELADAMTSTEPPPDTINDASMMVDSTSVTIVLNKQINNLAQPAENIIEEPAFATANASFIIT